MKSIPTRAQHSVPTMSIDVQQCPHVSSDELGLGSIGGWAGTGCATGTYPDAYSCRIPLMHRYSSLGASSNPAPTNGL